MIQLVPRFDRNDIKKAMIDRALRIRAAIILRLQRVGETFVKNARESGQYNDVTGNLRNSIGYIVMVDGNVVHQDFRRAAAVKKGIKVSKGGKDGVNAAKDLAFEVGQNFKKGYALIVVAGMEYAASVESRGKDVLTASSITAKNDLRVALVTVDQKIKRFR